MRRRAKIYTRMQDMPNSQTRSTGEGSTSKPKRNTGETLANRIDGFNGTPSRVKGFQYDPCSSRPIHEEKLLPTDEFNNNIEGPCYSLPR